MIWWIVGGIVAVMLCWSWAGGKFEQQGDHEKAQHMQGSIDTLWWVLIVVVGLVFAGTC